MTWKCNICPRRCNVDRTAHLGFCGAANKIKLNTCQLHYGEEPVISGSNGSGTIFFSHCNMRCIFCQNFELSAYGWGDECSIPELVSKMLLLQEKGAHNINLVTPTHYSHLLKDAIADARKKGLLIPIVWNSSGYELAGTLKTLEGLVDIYMPDFKYFDPESSIKYSGTADYPKYAMESMLEMHRQVGYLKLNDGVAMKGLLVRLLVLPGNVNKIEKILEWIHDNLGNETYISLMGQYYPTHQAKKHPEMNRCITQDEYDFALDQLERLGFENGFIQQVGSNKCYTPDFSNTRNKTKNS